MSKRKLSVMNRLIFLIEENEIVAFKQLFNQLISSDSINATGFTGLTILHHASASGNPHIVDFLIKNGADINSNIYGDGCTPLIHTIKTIVNARLEPYDYSEVIKLLFQNGAQIDEIPNLRREFRGDKDKIALLNKIQKIFGINEEISLFEEENYSILRAESEDNSSATFTGRNSESEKSDANDGIDHFTTNYEQQNNNKSIFSILYQPQELILFQALKQPHIIEEAINFEKRLYEKTIKEIAKQLEENFATASHLSNQENVVTLNNNDTYFFDSSSVYPIKFNEIVSPPCLINSDHLFSS